MNGVYFAKYVFYFIAAACKVVFIRGRNCGGGATKICALKEAAKCPTATSIIGKAESSTVLI